MELVTLTSLLKAIGDPVRLRLLQLLLHHELSVGELVRVLELPQSTVSRHLRTLKDQGLVIDHAIGTSAYYRATLEADLGNGDAPLRDGLLNVLANTPLSAVERDRLDQIISLRGVEGDEFFDRIGSRWDILREDCFGPTFHLQAFMHLLPSEWTVADLGSGTGYLLPPLARRFRKVIGVDLSQQMIELAERQAAEQGLDNVELRHGALEKLPLAAGEIDLAVAVLMLHHLVDVPVALAEIHRALKPGGRALIVEIYLHTNESFRARMADRRRGIDREKLAGWLRDAGFGELEHWDYPANVRPEHELAPLPQLYGVVATRS